MFTAKNRVESRVVKMYWNDGLLDVLAGCGVMLVGIAWLANLVPLGAVAPALLLPLWRPLRARITEPRLGYVEFSDRQQGRNRAFLGLVIVLGIVTMMGGIAAYWFLADALPWDRGRLVRALPAFLVGLLSLLAAVITSQMRFVAYWCALALFGVLAAAVPLEPGWSLLAGGVAGVVGGVIAMTQFMARYPLPADAK